MGLFALLVVAAAIYLLLSKTARPTDTVFIKLGLSVMLAPFLFLLLGMLAGVFGAKGTIGFFFGAVAMGFVTVPLGLLLALFHVLVRAFGKKAK